MCGIAFLHTEAPALDAARLMHSALSLLHHRGPDDSGIIEAGSAVVGHRRLSIIDINGSRQPMQDPSGRFTLSYNGEIYNFREVRKSLLECWEFKTDGDTELLLAGLIIKGEEFLHQLEGMWAFVLWDSEAKKLLLARDRFGKKPLFFNTDQNGIAIASEIRSLRALCGSDSWSENSNAVANYFRYGFCLPGETFYTGVQELLPGHFAKWQPRGTIEATKYWQPSIKPFAGSFRDACELLRDKFIASVRRRMVSDVEVGAFLSGGIDSSLIVSTIRRFHSGPLKTFTIGFSDSGYDERAYARLVAERFSTEHYEEVLTDLNSQKLAKLVLENVGQPFADASLLPTAMVAELASRHVKVALSGDGSDELFAGYQRYAGRKLANVYCMFPEILRSVIETALRSLPEPRVHHSHSLRKKAHLFLDMLASMRCTYAGPRLLAEHEVEALLGIEGFEHNLSSTKVVCPDSVTEMMLTDQMIYLPQDILTKVDRATMAYSLESRAPFLDKEVSELAQSFPLAWHMNGLNGKNVLRESFKDWLPASIWKRRKHGFAVPLGSWFIGELGNELENRISEREQTLNRKFILDRLALHRALKRDFGQFLWTVYVYLLWHERQIRA